MSRAGLVSGVVLVALGLAYLLDDLGVLAVRVDVLAPVLLVLAGLALTLAAARAPDR